MTLSVTADELIQVAARIGAASADLKDARRGHPEFHGAAGSGRIDDHLDDFFGHATDAAARLARDLDAIAIRLIDAAGAYVATEKAIVKGAGGA